MSEHQVQENNNQSTADLLRDLSRQLTDLIHGEVELAKAEMAQKAKRAGVGASLLAVAGGLVLFSGGAFVAAAIAALSQVMSVWLAAVIVGVVLVVGAGLVAMVGRGQLARGTPLAPAEAIEDTKEDVEWLRTQARSARR